MLCNNRPVSTEQLGLRDRKRAQTREALEQAAVTLVLRDGLEHTTVDAISALANVSPRTFFNYFDGKDSAILGLSAPNPEPPTEEQLATCAGQDLVESIITLILAVMGAPSASATIREGRMEIIRRHPELLSSKLARLNQVGADLTVAVTSLMERDGSFSSIAPNRRPIYAELLLSLCGGAVGAAVKDLASNGELPDTDDIASRAAALAREVTEKLR